MLLQSVTLPRTVPPSSGCATTVANRDMSPLLVLLRALSLRNSATPAAASDTSKVCPYNAFGSLPIPTPGSAECPSLRIQQGAAGQKCYVCLVCLVFHSGLKHILCRIAVALATLHGLARLQLAVVLRPALLLPEGRSTPPHCLR